MSKGKPKSSVALVQEVAEIASGHAKEIVQLVEVTRRQNRTGVNANLDKAGAGNAAMAVRNGLIARICVLVAGAYSPTQKRDKHLRVAFEILRDSSLMRREVAKLSSQRTVREAQILWNELLNESNRRQVKHFRDKSTAHLAEPDSDIGDPTFEQFLDFALKTATLMQMLAHAAGKGTEPINSFKDRLVKSAEVFWSPWKSNQ